MSNKCPPSAPAPAPTPAPAPAPAATSVPAAPPGNGEPDIEEYSFYALRKRLTWSFQLPNSSLRQQYIAFFVDKTSMEWLFFSIFISLCWFLPVAVLRIEECLRRSNSDGHTLLNYKFDNSYVGGKELLVAKLVCGVLQLLFIISGCCAAYYLLCLQKKSINQQYQCITKCLLKFKTDNAPFVRSVRHFYVFALQIVLLIPIIQRTILTPTCQKTGESYSGPILNECTSIGEKSANLMSSCFLLQLMLLAVFAHLPEVNLNLIWLNQLMTLIVGCFCGSWIGSFNTVVVTIITVFGVNIVVIDLSVRNIMIFLTTMKLEKLLVNNERRAEESHAVEMRNVIANVAHDLKTPLSSFTTGIDLVQLSLNDINNYFDSGAAVVSNMAILKNSMQDIQMTMNNIRNTNGFMVMTINRCIDFAKASRGMKLVPRYETINLQETLNLPLSCMINIQNRIHINLKNFNQTDICSHIITDKQWLQENILCLLSNAVKYSSEGSVTISVMLETESDASEDHRRRNSLLAKRNKRLSINRSVKVHSECDSQETEVCDLDADIDRFLSHSIHDPPSVHLCLESELPTYNKVLLRFEIEDTGIGMSEVAMKSLFTAFKQNQRMAGGTGLGLFSLAKRMEALNGSYGVMRRRDGQEGSLFWFSIPYRPDEITAAEVAMETNLTCNTSVMVEEFTQKESKPVTAQMVPRSPHSLSLMASPRTVSASLKVLLADDSPAIVKMTQMMLRRMGHDVVVADNGAVAVKKVIDTFATATKPFDVILMDLEMPVMDGLEATKRIREFENTNGFHHFVIGMSANSDSDVVEFALSATMNVFMPKPFSMETFNAMMTMK